MRQSLGTLVNPRDASVLRAILPDFAVERLSKPSSGRRFCALAAWRGSRRGGLVERRAASRGLPFVLFGEGLLRSPPGWGRTGPVLSVTAHMMTGPGGAVDILDPGRRLAAQGWESPALMARAAAARRELSSRRIGGAWWHSGADPELPAGRDGYVLIVAGEGDRRSAAATPAAALLRGMLADALADNAARRIVLLGPVAGRERGSIAAILQDAAACGSTVLTRPVDPWEAIRRAGCVYAAGGETGFLALLAGIKVRCFADSFYAGWGVTADHETVPQKPFRRTVDEIFAGACLLATRYLDPYRNTAASFEEVLAIIGDWRQIEAANRRVAVCIGMSFWKRRQVADFVRSSSGRPVFRRGVAGALARANGRPGAAVVVWASRTPAGLAKAAENSGVPLIRVEDGFLRSVGLGSDFMPAASLVFDSRGMHFDPTVRSDLEILLRETCFDSAIVERARRLIALLVARGVTKYNLGHRPGSIEWPAGRRRLLVPGQVEDDLSVRLGGLGIHGNLDLLSRARAANPDAFIAYKPHPDVEAGHRQGRIPDAVALGFADRIVRDTSTALLLAEIDELHTLTSLAGFEALLRRRKVVVYGRPFYAGWGLTCDLATIDRGRQLTIEELVAGALILYPRYLDPVTRLPCGPEIVIERFDNPELWKPGLLVLVRRLQGALNRRWHELAGRYSGLQGDPAPPSRPDNFRTF